MADSKQASIQGADSIQAAAKRALRKCPKCKDDKDIAEFIQKRGAGCVSDKQVAQIICKLCNNAMQRIGRLGDRGFVKVGDWCDLTEEEKAETMQKAHNLTGQDLAACINSSIYQSRTAIQKRKFECQEAFMSEEKLKIEFKNQPQLLKELLATPEDLCFKCDQTGIRQYPVPTYSRSTSNEEEKEERRERVIEMTEKVKAKAKAKALPKAKKPRLTDAGDRKFYD